MASLIILALYFIILIVFILTALFIVYHLVRFSVESELKIVMLITFVLVSTGLMLSNMLLFFSIDWNQLVTNFLR